MEYHGIKLTEVTESQIVDPPKKMLVWDYDPGCLLKADVIAIVNGRDGFPCCPVITTTGTFRHCAVIPEDPKTRRVTNRELSKWLAKGHGEYRNQGVVSSLYTYDVLESDEAVPSYIRVRKWDDADWHEPTVDYMDIEQ